MRVLVSLCLAIAFGATFAAAQQSPDEPTVWYAITSGTGAAIGHGSTEVVERRDGRDVIETQIVFLQEQGEPATNIIGRTVYSQDRDGRTLVINATTQTGRFVSHTDVRVDAGIAHIVNRTPTGRWTSAVALNPSVRFDGGEGLLARWDPVATPRLEFENFNVDAMSVDRVVIEARPPPPSDTAGVSALRFEYRNGGLVGITQLTIDRAGRLIDSAQPMFGSMIHLRVTDERTALAPHLPYPLIPNSAMRSPVRISPTAAQSHIRYRISFREGIAFALPQTGEQQVTQGNEAVVDICAECGPGLGADDATLADALRPTAWLQSDNPRVRAIAAPIAAMAISDTQKMRLLLQRAKPYIARPDYAGHYSALDTIARRAGDCTEAATLLAALGRAAGIPTRVASGVAYSRQAYFGVSNAFLAHSWTLAYVDGRWRSFDLALENFDSTHIALTIGNGDARSIAAASQLASLLRFDSLVEVRAAS